MMEAVNSELPLHGDALYIMVDLKIVVILDLGFLRKFYSDFCGVLSNISPSIEEHSCLHVSSPAFMVFYILNLSQLS